MIGNRDIRVFRGFEVIEVFIGNGGNRVLYTIRSEYAEQGFNFNISLCLYVRYVSILNFNSVYIRMITIL